jgi:succinate dehydrogenase/fumarate reductase flavoprotein subunit
MYCVLMGYLRIGAARGAGTAGLVAALALAGCSTDETVLDVGKVKHDIAAAMAAKNHITTPVTCPQRKRVAPVKKGQRFTCQAHLAIGTVPVVVTQTDNKGNVNVRWAPFTMIPTARLKTLITTTIADRTGLHAIATCPQPVLERKGLNFTCRARAAGETHTVDVTQTGARGQVSIHVR